MLALLGGKTLLFRMALFVNIGGRFRVSAENPFTTEEHKKMTMKTK
jgi:hypothetical protein